MAYKIRWSPQASADFEDICNYIARDSEHYARVFAVRVNTLIKNLPDFPRSGRIVPEYGMENLREKIYENYRIVYRIKEDFIEMVTICHGAKLLGEIS